MNEQHIPTSPAGPGVLAVAALSAWLGLAAPASASDPGHRPAPSAISGPLTPTDAVRLAMAHSPSLAAAVVELRRAALLVSAEDHRYRPLLTLDAGWTHRETPSLRSDRVEVAGSDDVALGVGVGHTFPWGTGLSAQLGLNGAGRDFTQPDTASTLRLGPTYGLSLLLRADQPLLRGLGTEVGEAGLRRARQARSAAEAARQRSASELAEQVLTAYWELWFAESAVDIQRQAQALAERQLREAELRRDAGAIAPLDVLPLLTELARVREAVSAARGVVRQRQVSLARLVGAPLAVLAQGVATSAAPPEVPALSRDAGDLTEAAVANAYELRELQTVVARARIGATLAAEQSLPRLDLSAWLAFEGLGNQDAGDALEMFGAGEAVSGYVGLAVELPLDATQRDDEAQRARLAVQAAQAHLRDATERVTAAAVQRLEIVRTAQQRVRFAKETAAIAARSAGGQQARFDAGDATATELVVAEQAHRQAKLRVARAQADLAIAHAALQHLTGSLLDQVALLTTR